MKLQKHFADSLAYRDYVANHMQQHGEHKDWHFSESGSSNTMHSGLSLLQTGDESHVAEANTLLQQFQEKIEVEHSYWGHSVAGYFPDVPAYLASDPESMCVKVFEHSDRTPLRVFVGITSSAGVSEQQLVKRGVTLAAFALAMIEKRPVIITPYVNLGNHGSEGAVISWDISTQPLVIGELMASLSCPEITRYVGIYSCHVLNECVTGAWDPDYNDEAKMRVRLGARPEDIYLGSIHLTDPLLKDPIAWIKSMLAKYRDEE